MDENNVGSKEAHTKACGSAKMQIEQIILNSAYFKVRQKEIPRLKIELKRS